MTKGVAIGIDLGATTSRIGIWEENHVKLIENELGKRKTPSYVSINNEEHLVGDLALNNIEINPENTIFNIKRIMGSQFNAEDMNHWSFKIVDKNGNPNVKGRPYIQINYKNEVKQLTTEEITSMILSKMKEVAEYYLSENDLDQTITDIVVTVPSYFNKNQRQAMIDAGKIVDLNVNIINESTAAALAYGFKNKIKNKENILLINFGGCSYEVLLFSIVNEEYILKAVSGDSHLGGEDITNNLVDYFIRIINKKYNKDISNDLQAKYRLRNACEDIKCKLSSIKEKCIKISNLFDGITFEEIITRDDFEKLNSNLFNRLINPLKNINNYLKLNKLDISDIILVGGSSHIPIVRNTILSYFNRNEIKKNINPDEAIVTGAVIQASIISKESEKTKNIIISDDNEKFLYNFNDTEDEVEIKVENNVEILSENEIELMKKRAKKINNDSEKENERKNSMNNLENLIIEHYKLLNSEDIDFIFERYKSKLIDSIKFYFKWVSNNNNNANPNDYSNRMLKIKISMKPICQMMERIIGKECMERYYYYYPCQYFTNENNINYFYTNFKKITMENINFYNNWNKKHQYASKEEYDENISILKDIIQPINQMIKEYNKFIEEENAMKNLEKYIKDQSMFLSNNDIYTYYINYKNKLIYNINLFITNKEQYISIINNNIRIIDQIIAIFKPYKTNCSESYDNLIKIHNYLIKMIEKDEKSEIEKYLKKLKNNILCNDNCVNSIYNNFKEILINDINKRKNWINNNQFARKEEYDFIKRELENTMKTIYQIKEDSEKYQIIEKQQYKEEYINLINNLFILTNNERKWYKENNEASMEVFKAKIDELKYIIPKLFF